MRRILLTFCILAMVIVVNADISVNQENKNILNNNTASYNMSIKVKVYLTFGFPPYEWMLPNDKIEELKARLNNLPLTTPIPIPELMYVLITNENKSPYFPYYQIYVCYYHNTLIAIDNKGEKKYYKGNDTDNNFIEWLNVLIYEHDPHKPKQIIPPDTPRMGFIQSDFFYPQATVKQNTKLKMPAFVIFSDGTALLEGTILVPEFVTISREVPDREVPGLTVIINKTSVTFSIPPRTGGEGFEIEVDTSKPREIIGEIIIKSNDKNMSEIKIPIHYIILPADNVSYETVEQEPEKPDYNTYIIIGIIITTILLSLFVIYYKKFR